MRKQRLTQSKMPDGTGIYTPTSQRKQASSSLIESPLKGYVGPQFAAACLPGWGVAGHEVRALLVEVVFFQIFSHCTANTIKFCFLLHCY